MKRLVAVAVLAPWLAACGGLSHSSGRSNATQAFNACIGLQPELVVVARRGSGSKVVEMIKDRTRGAVVGEFARLSSVRAAQAIVTPVGGFGARSGRYVVFTRFLLSTPMPAQSSGARIASSRRSPLDHRGRAIAAGMTEDEELPSVQAVK
jgi:hypothetical protein